MDRDKRIFLGLPISSHQATSLQRFAQNQLADQCQNWRFVAIALPYPNAFHFDHFICYHSTSESGRLVYRPLYRYPLQ